MQTIKPRDIPRRRNARFAGPDTPEWVLGDVIKQLTPDERMAMRYIAAFADILMVQETPYLLVQADQKLLDQLAAFEASVDDIEPEYEADELDTQEGEDYEDKEYTAQGFANPMCSPGQEWWLTD